MTLLTKLIGAGCILGGLWLAGDSLNVDYAYRDYSLRIKQIEKPSSKNYYCFIAGSLVVLSGVVIIGRNLSADAKNR